MTTLRIFILLFLTTTVRAQAVPPLERLISVDLRNEPIGQALNTIGRAGNFSFSYNPALLSQSRPITLRVTRRPVREVLGQLFGGTVRLKTRDNHVILVRADELEKPKDFLLDGYIIDGRTAERISAVTIFERNSLRSTISNNYGYYQLKLPANLSVVRLEVRRQTYLSQSLLVPTRRSQPLNVYLTAVLVRPALVDPIEPRPIPTDTATLPPLTGRPVIYASADSSAAVPLSPSLLDRSRRTLGRWALSTKQLITNLNLDRDTLYRSWQVSFVPGLSTNGLLAGRIINDYSINVLVGYSLGVRKLELGGFMNIIREDVGGLQAAGFGNLVGGNTGGWQAAGFANINRGNVGPVQLAGFVNTVGRNLQGVQAAGFVNAVGGSTHGVQLTGFVNADRGDVRGLQLAGFVNADAQNTQGVQGAGFVNVVRKNMQGVQIAGFANVVGDTLRGWQLSGFLNVAKDVTSGHQVGFINVARSSKTVPIGFLSYVHTGGYRNLELAANEVTPLNATFRTGVRQFYNIFTAGINPSRNYWSYGYGLGTATNTRKGWSMAVEGTVHQVNSTNRAVLTEDANLLLRLSPMVVRQFGTRIGLSVGPTFNAYRSPFTTYNPLTGVALPAVVVSPNRPDTNRDLWTGWLGWQGGVRMVL